MHRSAARLFAILVALAMVRPASAQPRPRALPAYDFTRPETVEQWRPAHDVARMEPVGAGMRIDISGGDPYLIGPAADYPVGQPLWLRVRLRSDQGGVGQIFYFQTNPTEENSIHFGVKAGEWVEVRAPMVALGPGYHLRLDPPGSKGTCIVAYIRFEPRTLLEEPAWPKPTVPNPGRNAATVTSGPVALRHAPSLVGAFEVRVAGARMAVGNAHPLIGYLAGGRLRWLDLARAGRTTLIRRPPGFTVACAAKDPDGGKWLIETRFAPGPSDGRSGAVNVNVTVRIDRDREVVYLPWMSLLAGVGSFGSVRDHGLFCGLEYLDKPDRSSSEADIRGPGARRQTPNNEKITVPLMAIQNGGLYVGLAWKMDPQVTALFDSPDRIYRSGGHVMGLLFPGSDGSNREEGRLLPYQGQRLGASRVFQASASILGGRGESVVPAVRQYVQTHPLPDAPPVGAGLQSYVRLAAHGWLDSKIRVGNRYRHAYWPGISGFAPTPAADAALFMEWLARRTADRALASRLLAASEAAILEVPLAQRHAAGVSHVRYPSPALAFGATEQAVQSVAAEARSLLQRFEPDGVILYRPTPGELDYGRTHFAKHANGLTAPVVEALLKDAALCGDPELIRQALGKLAALDRYRNEAPRGAQTWEVPLHTPDILASAHLVSAYLIGYELTGRSDLLEKARYWAWTGVPFVYLTPPSPGRVGLYATVPVFGATQWTGSWFGLPVQWCGLVYADALYRLARYDGAGPWKRLADGIAASGIQQSWPASDADLGGLLPDSFAPATQTRNPVAINPGTVQACAIRLFGGPMLYDFRRLRASGLIVHAPAGIAVLSDTRTKAAFVVQGWLGSPYDVLVNRVGPHPKVTIDGKPADLAGDSRYDAGAQRLILRVQGKPRIEIAK
jgi:hypothetical protein